MPSFYPVSVEIEGRRYSGEWELRQGGEVRVRSPAYGVDCAPIGQRRPEQVAPEVLAKIVRDWQRKREREARQVDRETQRVARSGRPKRQ